MTDQAKRKLGTIASLAVIVGSVIIMGAFYYGTAAILWILSITNLISGPACLIMYLREAKKGIFNENDVIKEK